MTVSPPGRSSLASTAISRNVLCIQSLRGELTEASTWMILGSSSTRSRAAGWSKPTAPQTMFRAGAAPTMPEDLVAVAQVLALEVVNDRRFDSGLAAEAMALAVRDQREVARLQQARLGSLRVEPAPAGSDHVEPQVARHRRQLQPPRRGELRAAVEGAAHAQEVERLPERVSRGRPRIAIAHEGKYAYRLSNVLRNGRTSINRGLLVIYSPEPDQDTGRVAQAKERPPVPGRRGGSGRDGIRRTDTGEPRQRRADHVPPDRGGHER